MKSIGLFSMKDVSRICFLFVFLVNALLLSAQNDESRYLPKEMSDSAAFEGLKSYVENNFNRDGKSVLYINDNKKEIGLSGTGPLTIYALRDAMDGGVYKYNLRLSIESGRWHYTFISLLHHANPASEAKIKDGGDLRSELPASNSGIWKKNWKRMQDQAMIGIRRVIEEIDFTIENMNK